LFRKNKYFDFFFVPSIDHFYEIYEMQTFEKAQLECTTEIRRKPFAGSRFALIMHARKEKLPFAYKLK